MARVTDAPAAALPDRGTDARRVQRAIDTAHPRRLSVLVLLAAAALTAALLGQQLILGRSPFGEPGEWKDVWVAMVHCWSAVYLPAAYFAVLVSGRRSAAELGFLLDAALKTESVSALPPFQRPSPTWLVAGVVGGALTFIGPWLTEPDVGGPLAFWHTSAWPPEVFWHRVLGLWIGVWLGWYALALVQVSVRVSRLARKIHEFDFFDPVALRPFVRHGARNGLIAAGSATLVGLLGLDMGLTMMLLVFGGSALALVVVAVALPVIGVSERMRAARSAELKWCDAAIAAQRSNVRAGAAEPGAIRLADLVAYRGLVEHVNTWPIDTQALRRVTLYLLIPLFSWIASALVQEVVQQAMSGG